MLKGAFDTHQVYQIDNSGYISKPTKRIVSHLALKPIYNACNKYENQFQNTAFYTKHVCVCFHNVVSYTSSQPASCIHCNYNNNNPTNDTTSASVVNFSSFQLTPAMTSLLSKGLNFCPTPGEPNVLDLRGDLDKFHVSLRRNQFFSKQVVSSTLLAPNTTSSLDTPLDIEEGPFDHRQFRNPSTWCPKGPINLESMIIFNEYQLNEYTPMAPGNQNLTLEEKQALAELKSNHDIVIKPADKGSAVVIQDRQSYIDEGLRQLNNPDFYIEVPNDLTNKHNSEVYQLLQDLVNDDQISAKCADYLHLPKARTPQLYLLPKIHKNKDPVPGRPIVSGNSSPTERISELADHFLQPLVQSTPSFVRDTTDFLSKIDEIEDLLPGTMLCTIDVTSLYTNIPNEEGIRACAAQLAQHRPNPQPPSNHTIVRLLDYVLNKNNFDFNNKHYLQVGGTAMGTKVAPYFANLFMADFETKHVYTYPTKPSLWLRYFPHLGTLN